MVFTELDSGVNQSCSYRMLEMEECKRELTRYSCSVKLIGVLEVSKCCQWKEKC